MDDREAILVRLLAIAGGLQTAKYAARNLPAIDEDDIALPAVIVLDGDEDAIDDEPSKRPSAVPRWVEMTPMLHIVMGSKPEDIGTELNLVRAELIKTVLLDPTLNQICKRGGNRGGVRYDGMESARNEAGRLVVGQRYMRFTFGYLLIPDRL